MNSDAKKLLLIELNEFSVDLFKQGVHELGLPHIAKLLAMRESSTKTDDAVEHRGLDPWVQWVSIHTGVPSSTHGIIHLGDTPAQLENKQVWETLGANGISSGVWGAMNATREGTEACAYFLPDPWTFSEQAHPPSLNGLLSLPRYYSKNYLDVSVAEFAKRTARLVGFIAGSGAVWRIIRQAPLVLSGLLRSGINNATLFSLFDLFSACIFVGYRKKYQVQFTVVFLNSIAHLQHHRWTGGERLGKDMQFGLRVMDRVLEILFGTLADDEAVIIMNALTQRNISGEKPRICYRQINPAKFLAEVGLRFDTVEQLMTNDAHVFFATDGDFQQAAQALASVTVHGKAMFDVDGKGRPGRKLFYQVDFWDELDGDVELEINGTRINFLDHFEAIVARTGAHISDGNVFARGIELPARMYNHEMAGNVLSYFGVANPASSAAVVTTATAAVEQRA